jgi:hypothetical protein
LISSAIHSNSSTVVEQQNPIRCRANPGQADFLSQDASASSPGQGSIRRTRFATASNPTVTPISLTDSATVLPLAPETSTNLVQNLFR